MICGWDETGPQIYYVDSDGQRLHGPLFSVGSGSTFAYGVLDTGYRYDLSFDEACDLARRAIFAATYRDAYSGGTVRVYHIDADGWHRISEDDSMARMEPTSEPKKDQVLMIAVCAGRNFTSSTRLKRKRQMRSEVIYPEDHCVVVKYDVFAGVCGKHHFPACLRCLHR